MEQIVRLDLERFQLADLFGRGVRLLQHHVQRRRRRSPLTVKQAVVGALKGTAAPQTDDDAHHEAMHPMIPQLLHGALGDRGTDA